MNLLLKYNRLILAILLVAGVFMGPGISRLTLSYRVDDYFSASGEDLQIYNRYRQVFGEDDQFLLCAIRTDSSIYQPSFLRKIRQTRRALEQIPELEQVLWLDDWLPRIVRPSRELAESIPESRLFVSRDHHSVSLLIRHRQLEDKTQMKALVTAIETELERFGTDQIYIAGKIYFSLLLADIMREDAMGLFLMVFVLILLILFLSLGSFRMLLVCLGIPLVSIVFTLGLMGMLDFHINMFTTMVPTLILIISVSDIIHIVKGAGPEDKLQRIRYHFAALLLTSLTTAIGFASLLSTSISAIMLFGGFVAIGVLYTFLLTTIVFSLIPTHLYRKTLFLDKALDRMVREVIFLYKKPWIQILTVGCVLLMMSTGISKIRPNAYLISGIPEDSPIRTNSRFFDEYFAGTRPLSIYIEKRDSTAKISAAVFSRLDSLIRQQFHTSVLISPNSLRSQMKMASTDSTYLRFYGLMKDEGSQVSSRRADSLMATIAGDSAFSPLTIHYTGISRMSDKNTTDIAQSIFTGILIVLAVTFVLLAIFFRSFLEASISLIVNIIPLLVLASAYGLIGLELRAGNSIAFVIAIGIAIDDTMHLLANYKKQRANGKSFDKLLANAGKPIILTTIVFALSFSVLLFSELEPVSTLGLAIVVGSISALAADLIILPALLRIIQKKE